MSELKIDFGCGPSKRDGFLGIDRIDFPGVDAVCDLTALTWVFDRNPFGDAAEQLEGGWRLKDNSVDEAHASHFVEHLWNTTDRPERVRFVNELFRVLKPGGKCTIITPHWCSNRAYGDFTHCFPPVAEFWFFYLDREWRMGDKSKGIPGNAPHDDAEHNPDGYTCDFDFTCGYSLHPAIQLRSPESQQFAMSFYKEAAQDLIATITKPLKP